MTIYGRSEELVSRCVECDLAEPESLTSLGGSAPGVVDGILSCVIRTKDYAIKFRTDQPDYSFLPDQDFDWTYSVYGSVKEILPDDMSEPLGKAVITTTTMDANLNTA